MRIHAIRSVNFLALQDFVVEGLDPHLSFLVGPNGAGKSTVFRVLRTFADTSSHFAAGGGVADLKHMHTLGARDPTVDVSIDVEFETSWEQSLWAAFLAASFAMPNHIMTVPVEGQQRPTTAEGRLAYLNWILDSLAPTRIPYLFRGTFRLTYRHDLDDSMRLTYTFRCGDTPMTFVAGAPHFFGCELVLGDPPDGPVVKAGMGALAGFLEAAGIHNDANALLLGVASELPPPLDVPGLLRHLTTHQFNFVAEMPSFQTPISPTHRRLADLLGQPWSGRTDRGLSLVSIFSLLLRRAMVFTNNLRAPLRPEMDYEWPRTEPTTSSSLDELDVPLRLFLLKNGDAVERGRFRHIQDTFTALVGSGIRMDVVASPIPPMRENAGERGDVLPQIRIDVKALHPQGEVSMAYEGAGRWETLILATLLDESHGRVLLLDEPVANLHPGMQRQLLDILRDVSGQVIISTHSAHLLPTKPRDFQKVLRLYRGPIGTEVARLDSAALQRIRDGRLEQELASSSDVAALLFTSGVILVEGLTETAALEEWFVRANMAAGRTLADLNLAIHAVGSKTAFAFYLRYLHAFRIPWVVICDGDAFSENNSMWGTLTHIAGLPQFTEQNTFEQRRYEAERVGVYTPNTSPKQSFEDIPSVRQHLASLGQSRSKPRDAWQLARAIPCPPEVERILRAALQRLVGESGEKADAK